MLYDITTRIVYEYEVPASGARHVVRVMPMTLPGIQRLVAGSVTMAPVPEERVDFADFFGNPTLAVNLRTDHAELEIRMHARVQVETPTPQADLSPELGAVADETFPCWSLAPDSPHHFLGESPRLFRSKVIAAWARQVTDPKMSIREAANALCQTIHKEFDYLPGATKVDTSADAAFKLKKGVCQDFAHVMIVALRALGVPAAYVSGYLRTIPPAGKERLEGADAMHAWVRVWCGQSTGWLEWDPTNDMMAGNDHIRAAFGRDYSDVAPVIGILKSYGSHTTEQYVDVVPV